MSTTYTYQDNNNGDIDNDNILLVNQNGLIEKYGEKGFKYIPQNELTYNPSGDGNYVVSNIDDLPTRPNLNSFTNDDTTIDNVSISSKLTYYFGLDKIQINKTKYDKVSAYISPTINIGNSSYIKLSVQSNKDISSNIEFSIIEEENENPILPIEIEDMITEKLFFRLDTRFPIDNTQKYIIKENNLIISATLDELNNKDFNSNVYTIQYVPIKQSYLYYPKTDNIKVKVVQRIMSEDTIPAVIKSITILKFGGNKIWNI